ncbi:MAG: M28 family peptidase [Synechococcaceae cyanobacterium]
MTQALQHRLPGQQQRLDPLLVGAHYDGPLHSIGADDNATGVAALPAMGTGRLLPDVRLSDHSPFWDAGYDAVMVTDTSFMRNPNYHCMSDTLDLPFLAAVIEGLDAALSRCACGMPGATRPTASRPGWPPTSIGWVRPSAFLWSWRARRCRWAVSPPISWPAIPRTTPSGGPVRGVDPFAFFAVELRAVRIGSSPIAPLFEVMAKPNGLLPFRQIRPELAVPAPAVGPGDAMEKQRLGNRGDGSG